jgi:hypothetical protein
MPEIDQYGTLDKKRETENRSHQAEIEVYDKRVICLSRFMSQYDRHPGEQTAQQSKQATLTEGMEVGIDKDINPCQAHSNENDLPFPDQYPEKEIRKEHNEQRIGIKKYNGIGQRNDSNGFEHAKK